MDRRTAPARPEPGRRAWPERGRRPAPRARIHIAVFLALVATIAFVGRGAYTTLQNQFDVDLRTQIDEVADLKAKQVASWRTERLGDAAVAVAGAQLMPAVPQVLRGTSTPAIANQLRAWIEAIRVQYLYETIVLVDTEGRTRLSAGQLLASPERYAALANEALRTDRVVFRDLPRDADVVRSHFTLAARLIHEDGTVAGAIVLGIDPTIPRYRLILTWPSDSRTGDVVLARRFGGTVLYLSTQRQREPSVNLIASERPVPESDWLVIASLDTDEAYAPLRRTLNRLLQIGAVLILMSGVGIALIWRYQRATFERQRAEAERERQALVGHYEFLTRFGNDSIVLADEEGFIKEVNDRTVECFGFTREELLQLNVRSFRGPDDEAGFQSTWDTIKQQRRLVFETMVYRKDRSLFPVELSVRAIDVEGRTYIQSIIRDITERRHAAAQIRLRGSPLNVPIAAARNPPCSTATRHTRLNKSASDDACTIA